MRYFILLLLTLGLGVSACSKKSSSSAPPPVTDDDNNNNYHDDYGDPVNGDYYTGYVSIRSDRINVYMDFIRAGLYNGYSSSNSWSYTYTCSTNFLSWIFQGGSPINCGGSGYNDYVYYLATKPAMVELSFENGSLVEGRWLLNATQGSNGQVYYEQAISFNANLSVVSHGRYMLEAGPLVLLNTLGSSSQVNFENFDVYFDNHTYDTKFGNVTIQ